jgi:uncharacterized membrane protein
MARSIAEALLVTAVFLTTAFMVVNGEGLIPTVFGSYFLGGVATLISGISLGVALYEWDSHLQIFQVETHVADPSKISSKISSLIITTAGILSIIGLASMTYGMITLVV